MRKCEEKGMAHFTRRQFLKAGAGACMALGTPLVLHGCGDDEEEGRRTIQATVHTVLGDGLSDLYRMGRRAAQVLDLHESRGLSGKTVFIKPNFVVFGTPRGVDPSTGEWTKAEIVVAIAEHCLEAGAAKVSIGDGAQGVDWDWNGAVFLEGNTIFGQSNLKQAVDSLKTRFPHQLVELLCLNAVNEWEHIPSSSDHEMMLPGLKIARSFFEADHAISVPVLKTHTLANMTCSMKNYMGVTPSLPPYGSYGNAVIRDELHKAYAKSTNVGIEEAGITACFTDIVKWRKQAGKQDYAIVDCSIGIEGDGPSLVTGGKTINIKERCPANKYFLIASRDLPAADVTAARVMGMDARSMKQLRMARRLKLGETRNIRLVGDATLEEIRIPGFLKAEQVPEWAPSTTIPPCYGSTAVKKSSHAVNVLGAFGLAAGSVYLYRQLRGREQTTQKDLDL
jgi:uncharacterized protein (DUF362 family)